MPSWLDLVFTSSPSRRRSNIRFVLFPFLACLINLIEYFTGIWAWFLVEATIHGHMKPWWRTHGGWQDSRLVLSILTSISRGYELDSWAFPGLILYGSLTDWWPEIYILTGSTRDRSISRSEYSRVYEKNTCSHSYRRLPVLFSSHHGWNWKRTLAAILNYTGKFWFYRPISCIWTLFPVH